MTQSSAPLDNFICEEMLVHSLFYTHHNLKNIALIAADNTGLLREIVKHPTINSIWLEKTTSQALHDHRINFFENGTNTWLEQMPNATLDGIIITDATQITIENFQQIFQKLTADGIFIQQTPSLFNTEEIRSTYQMLQLQGFQDLQVMNFPVPSGSRSAIMAIKSGTFKRVREKDIFNKSFVTKFYNFDMHKAALALPEFVREELAI